MSRDTPGDGRDDPIRMVTVWCPDWPVVAAGCRPDVPAAVMRAHRVVARTPAAADEGIVIGQRRRQAQQRCPHIRLLDDDPARDAREFEPIVRAVAEIAPRVDLVEPGWLSIAARGPSRYFGGDEAMAEHLRRSVLEVVASLADVMSATPGSVRVDVGVGVADGRFAASVAARLGVRRREPIVVASGGSEAFCAPLPIGWLQTLAEVDAELVDLFGRLGLRRLGDLAGLDPADVLGRFGPVGMHAHRLASGVDIRPANTTDPAPERRLTRVLDDPAAQTDAVVFVAKQLADELAGPAGCRWSGLHPVGRSARDRARGAVRAVVVPVGGHVGSGDGRAGALAARRVGEPPAWERARDHRRGGAGPARPRGGPSR